MRLDGGDAVFIDLEKAAEDYEASRYNLNAGLTKHNFKKASDRLADLLINCLEYALVDFKQEQSPTPQSYADRRPSTHVQAPIRPTRVAPGLRKRYSTSRHSMPERDRKRRRVARHVEDISSGEEEEEDEDDAVRVRRSLRPSASRVPPHYADLDPDSDNSFVPEHHRRQSRPRRAKDNLANLNDDLAYQHMLERQQQRQRADELAEEQRVAEEEKKKRQPEVVHISPDDEEGDESDDIPRLPLVRPMPLVRNPVLKSDYLSLTPVITDDDDSTDCEQRRHFEARHPVWLFPKREPVVQLQPRAPINPFFPVPHTLRRMRRDFIVRNFSQMPKHTASSPTAQFKTSRSVTQQYTIANIPFLPCEEVRKNIVGKSRTLWPELYRERDLQLAQRVAITAAATSSLQSTVTAAPSLQPSSLDAKNVLENGQVQPEIKDDAKVVAKKLQIQLAPLKSWRVLKPHGAKQFSMAELIEYVRKAEEAKQSLVKPDSGSQPSKDGKEPGQDSAKPDMDQAKQSSTPATSSGLPTQKQTDELLNDKEKPNKKNASSGDKKMEGAKHGPLNKTPIIVDLDKEEQMPSDPRNDDSVQLVDVTMAVNKPAAVVKKPKPAARKRKKKTLNALAPASGLSTPPLGTLNPKVPKSSSLQKKSNGRKKTVKAVPSPLAKASSKSLPAPLRPMHTLLHRASPHSQTPPHVTSVPPGQGDPRYTTPELNLTMVRGHSQAVQPSAMYRAPQYQQQMAGMAPNGSQMTPWQYQNAQMQVPYSVAGRHPSANPAPGADVNQNAMVLYNGNNAVRNSVGPGMNPPMNMQGMTMHPMNNHMQNALAPGSNPQINMHGMNMHPMNMQVSNGIAAVHNPANMQQNVMPNPQAVQDGLATRPNEKLSSRFQQAYHQQYQATYEKEYQLTLQKLAENRKRNDQT